MQTSQQPQQNKHDNLPIAGSSQEATSWLTSPDKKNKNWQYLLNR